LSLVGRLLTQLLEIIKLVMRQELLEVCDWIEVYCFSRFHLLFTAGAICAAYDNTTECKTMRDILDIFPSVMDYSKATGSVEVVTPGSETSEDATLARNLQVSTTSVALQKDRGLLLSNIQSSSNPNVNSAIKSISKLYRREIAQPESN
jgi:hypothetical protein